MRAYNWKIFDKKGSFINWYRDAYLQISFTTDASNPVGGEAFVVTDVSGKIDEVVVTNSGYGWNTNNVNVLLTDTFDPTGATNVLDQSSTAIFFEDVSVFSPLPTTTRKIDSVVIDPSTTSFIYPSVSYSGAIFLEPVSQGLVETEHLSILEEIDGALKRPYDPSSNLVFRFVDSTDTEIAMFDVDEGTQEITWTDEVIFDTNVDSYNPIQLNIGFKSEEEGVYERRLRVYEKRLNDNSEHILAEIVVNAQSIGPDERFDTLLQNFAPNFNPKDFPKLFKETDINEDLPDWKVLNPKAKNMVLDYSQITPYIGTYKALVNSIKWLGFEDIQIREWFNDVKNNKKLSLHISYDAEERAKTILYFTPEERKNLKKLNELSLVYQINKETGDLDDSGVPETENVYEYNLKEIITKLSSLKSWLEKNVIGVNARITDITGEGIYFERFKNIIYGIQKTGSSAEFDKKITPISPDQRSELIQGDSSISLTILELDKTKVSDFNFSFRSLVDYGYDQDPSLYDGSTGVWLTIDSDSSLLEDFDSSIVRVGPSFKFPIRDILDINWRATVQKDTGVVTNQFMTKPLLVYDDTIKFYNTLDTLSEAHDVSTNIKLIIEKANFRDASNDVWAESVAYAITPNASDNGAYIMESSLGTTTWFNGFATFQIPEDPSGTYFRYQEDDGYGVPLFKFRNFEYTDGSANQVILDQDKEYVLDMIDGKIRMDSSTVDPDGKIINVTNYINFVNEASSLTQQQIYLNVEYDSTRVPLYSYDPSVYYSQQYLLDYLDPSIALTVDNSIYKFFVNHIGDYNIELFSYDSHNTNYYNPLYNKNGDRTYEVWTKYPTMYAYLDVSNNDSNLYDVSILSEDVSTLIGENFYPVYDRQIHLQGLTFRVDGNGNEYVEIPSVTFFQDTPEPGSTSRFYNLTERVTTFNKGPRGLIPVFGGLWQPHTMNATGTYIASTFGAGIFVSIKQTPGAGHTSSWSYDGSIWKDGSVTAALQTGILSDVAFGNNIFVLVVEGGNLDRSAYSSDGSTWTASSSLPLNDWQAVAFGNSRFVTVADTGANRVYTSVGGGTWTQRVVPLYNYSDVAYGNGRFIAIASNTDSIVVSDDDGVTWVEYTGVLPFTGGWRNIAYGDGKWIVLNNSPGISGDNHVAYSVNDGSTWSSVAPPFSNPSWVDLAYGEGGIFAGIGTDMIAYTDNAEDWYVSTTDTSVGTSITYGNGTWFATTGSISPNGRTARNFTEITFDPDFQSVNGIDTVNAVLFDRGKYEAIQEHDVSVFASTSDTTFAIASLPDTYKIDEETDIYILNTTQRDVYRTSTDPSIVVADPSNNITVDHFIVDVSNYVFETDQLVSVIITDTQTDNQYAASHRVLDSSAVALSDGWFRHALEGGLPDFVVEASTRYDITVKHPWERYFTTQMHVLSANDVSNNFEIYNYDPHHFQNYMDNTFTYVNIPFDEDKVNAQWFNTEMQQITGDFYGFDEGITIDTSVSAILRAEYDPSMYMLNQKNIWTIRTNDVTNKLIMRVFNESLPYTFDTVGTYNVYAESYDSYGNLVGREFEGFVKVEEE